MGSGAGAQAGGAALGALREEGVAVRRTTKRAAHLCASASTKRNPTASTNLRRGIPHARGKPLGALIAGRRNIAVTNGNLEVAMGEVVAMRGHESPRLRGLDNGGRLAGRSKLGPVVGPVVRAKLAAIDSGKLLNSNALVGRDCPPGAPVGDDLHGLTKGLGEGRRATTEANGAVDSGFLVHTRNVHDAFTSGQHLVSTDPDTSRMDGKAIWKRVDDELAHRKARGLAPSSWAELGNALGISRQARYNWTQRGIPAEEFQRIASALDWSVDQLLGAEVDDTPVLDASATEVRVIEALRSLSPEDRLEFIDNILSKADRAKHQRAPRPPAPAPIEMPTRQVKRG